ncbi:hypothetical protein ACFR99_05320 [Haloarchaeobius amylolyticus]|uniref:Uncharacterized protein n=1 Tax=Haloarchaeobius amylolyticus TaxID=1198296 RepID=A0ABD6BD35_9EURY
MEENWRRRATLTPKDANSTDGHRSHAAKGYGTAVALNGTVALVCDNADGPGITYAFELWSLAGVASPRYRWEAWFE